MHLSRLLNSSLLARHRTSFSLSFSSLVGSFTAVEPPMRLFFLAGSGAPCSLLAASTSSAGSLNLSFSYSACQQSGPGFSRKHESRTKSWQFLQYNACRLQHFVLLIMTWLGFRQYRPRQSLGSGAGLHYRHQTVSCQLVQADRVAVQTYSGQFPGRRSLLASFLNSAWLGGRLASRSLLVLEGHRWRLFAAWGPLYVPTLYDHMRIDVVQAGK